MINALCLFVGLVTAFFAFAKYSYSYWERKGFKSASGTNYLLGHFTDNFLRRKSLIELVAGLYQNSKDAYTGIYGIFKPILLVHDPEIVRDVLIRDFQHFTDRGVYSGDKFDPLAANLLAKPGHRWENLRSELTAFSLDKLKAICATIVERGQVLVQHIEKTAASRELVDVRDIGACHSPNVIASVVFGNEVDLLKGSRCDQKMVEPSFINGIRFFFTSVAAKLMRYFGTKQVDKEVEQFFRSVVSQNIGCREKNKVVRKNFCSIATQRYHSTGRSIGNGYKRR